MSSRDVVLLSLLVLVAVVTLPLSLYALSSGRDIIGLCGAATGLAALAASGQAAKDKAL